MGPTMRLALSTLLLGQLLGVDAARGTMKVAACVPGFAPFITLTDDGKLQGFEIDMWQHVWAYTLARETAKENPDPQILELLGDEPPELMRLSWPDTMAALDAATIDVGMCGFYVNGDRATKWDFLPTYLATGMRGMVRRVPPDLSPDKVLGIALGKPDSWAIFSLLVVFFLSFVYAHIIWLVERRDNLAIDVAYGPGVFDGMYLGLSVAATVTFGDKRPVTYLGIVITYVWMFTGTFLMAMFVASITSTILASKLGVSSTTIEINKPSDLAKYTIGTSFTIATNAVKDQAPGSRIVQYDTQGEMLEKLMNSEIDVVVEDAWTTQYIANRVEPYVDNVIPVGTTFHKIDAAIAMSRPGGEQNVLLEQFRRGMVDVMRGSGRKDHDVNVLHWFGNEILSSDLQGADNKALEESLGRLNSYIALTLVGMVVIWSLAVGFHYRKTIAENHRKAGLRRALQLGHKFTKPELREAAKELFRSFLVGKKSLSRRNVLKLGGSGQFGGGGKFPNHIASAATSTAGQLLPLTDVQVRLEELGTVLTVKDLYRIVSGKDKDPTLGNKSPGGFGSIGGARTSTASNKDKSMDDDQEFSRRKSSSAASAMSLNEEQFVNLIERLVLLNEADEEKEQHKPAMLHHVQDATEELKHILALHMKKMEEKVTFAIKHEINLANGTLPQSPMKEPGTPRLAWDAPSANSGMTAEEAQSRRTTERERSSDGSKDLLGPADATLENGNGTDKGSAAAPIESAGWGPSS